MSDIQDATVVSETPVINPSDAPTISDEQYAELIVMRDGINAKKAQGYEYLRFINRAQSTIQQADQMKGQLDEALRLAQENENVIAEEEQATIAKIQEFLKPYGLDNVPVQISETSPHYVLPQPPPVNPEAVPATA
jgi:sulfite reductase beta subunit-like hemoprotein